MLKGRTMSQSLSESVSLLQGYPYAALLSVSVWVSEILVKVSIHFRNTGLHYTKVMLEIRFLLYKVEETKITVTIRYSQILKGEVFT